MKTLLIVDMQKKFVSSDQEFGISDAAGILPNIKRILEYFRDNKLPVFYTVRTQVYTPQGKKEIPAEIVDELRPAESEYVIGKTSWSGFSSPDLDDKLSELGSDEIVVIGVRTPNCIRETVYDAVDRGYNVTVVSDAVAAQTREIHEANLRDMKNIGVNVVKTDEFLS